MPSKTPIARKSGPDNCESCGIECRISISTIGPKSETRISKQMLPRLSAASGFEFEAIQFVSDFDIRIWSFSSRSTHPRNFRQTKHLIDNVLSRGVFDLFDTDRIGDFESAGFRPAKRFQMRAATEHFSNIVNIRADIKAFAAQHREIDFR